MKNLQIFSLLVLLLSSVISLQSCKDDTVTGPPPIESPDTTGLTRIGSNYALGAAALVVLYSEEPLHTGYNKIYAVLYDSTSGLIIKDAHVSPYLTDHGIGGFAETPPEFADAGNRFPFGVVFVLPQATDHWAIKVGVHNHGHAGEPYGTASIGSLHIADTPGKFQMKGLPGDTTLYFSYIQPRTPVTGLNDFEFIVNRSKDTLNYKVDTTFNITIKPVLISSGEASTGNTNPLVSGTYKHYNGKVNFTAPGLWRINLYMTKSGYSDSTYFETSF